MGITLSVEVQALQIEVHK